MKKLVLIVLLAIMGKGANAQSAALIVTNHNSACGIYVKMYATDPTYGNTSGCDIEGCQFYLSAGGGSATFSNPGDYHTLGGGPGYCYMLNTMTHPDFIGTTTFQWTEVAFNWDCPPPPTCTSPTGIMADPVSSFGGTTCYSMPPSTWSGADCTAATSTWTSAATGVMDDVIIDFY